MYDVLYIDRGDRRTLLAEGLARDTACDLARSEAAKRKVGRMFLAGSEFMELGEVVVIVESERNQAAA